MKVIIIGGGQVGSYLASLLLKRGYDISIVENRNKKADLVTIENPSARLVIGNGSDPSVLEAAGIQTADIVAAVTGEDETNLVVATLAKMEYGVPRVVARVNNPKNAWLYTMQMGVDVGLNQADLIAHLVEEEVSVGDLVALIEIDKGHFTIVEETIKANHGAAGKRIGDLVVPSNCLVNAIIRKGVLMNPTGDTILEVGDKLVAVCATEEVENLSKTLEG